MNDALHAGDLGTWLVQIDAALEGGESDVPCGACTACCRSAQFIHVRPRDQAALEHIPGELLVPAPDAGDGTLIMGFDKDGRCPMLADDGCSIYEHRPLACRVYDCRVFAATGVESDREAIAAQARRWVFSGGSAEWEALHTAARYLGEQELPVDVTPVDATRMAVAAIRIRHLFADDAEPSTEIVAAELRR